MNKIRLVAIITTVLCSMAVSTCGIHAKELVSLLPGQVIEHALPDINDATHISLQQIGGVGEVRSTKIVEFIMDEGPVTNMNDLAKIKGVGVKTVQKVKESFTVYQE